MAPNLATSPKPSWRDRFYTIEGQRLPSVTTILDIITKPALGPWYAKEERRYFETAMLEVLSRPGARDPEYVLAAVAEAVTGVKAADREKQKAAAIGTAVHAGIEWELRRQLGEDAGPAPHLPEAAVWAVESWKDWARSVTLEPLAIERTVYCLACGYAGTLDLYAQIKGVLTVLDWKSGKRLWAVSRPHGRERAPRQHASNFDLAVPNDHLVNQRAQEVLPALKGQSVEAPEREPTKSANPILAGLLSILRD
jgi:hypothetical protein